MDTKDGPKQEERTSYRYEIDFSTEGGALIASP